MTVKYARCWLALFKKSILAKLINIFTCKPRKNLKKLRAKREKIEKITREARKNLKKLRTKYVLRTTSFFASYFVLVPAFSKRSYSYRPFQNARTRTSYHPFQNARTRTRTSYLLFKTLVLVLVLRSTSTKYEYECKTLVVPSIGGQHKVRSSA